MRQFSLEATERQKQIVAATAEMTVADAARKLGLTAARVKTVKDLAERRRVRALEVEREEQLPVLKRRLAFTSMPARAANCLMAAGFETVGAAASVPRRQLLKLDNFGLGSLRELERYIDEAATNGAAR